MLVISAIIFSYFNIAMRWTWTHKWMQVYLLLTQWVLSVKMTNVGATPALCARHKVEPMIFHFVNIIQPHSSSSPKEQNLT